METPKRLLLADDDRSLSPLVQEYLESKGFVCHLHHNGFDALDDFRKSRFNLCILDIKMPMKSGYELAAEIKNLEPDIPFLFLTGQADKEDRIKGLEAGADDYITKPFSMQELYLRIKAILKRTEMYGRLKNQHTKHEIGSYLFDAESREISRDSQIIKLSAIENKLLKLFCTAADGIVLRDEALKHIWEDENNFRERSLNVYVSRLRNYFKEDPGIEFMNIHGTGYKLVVKS
ncbi:MAG: response regulator transcription factor [Saprospiraceae bacterium]|nr:response regulator transcription factor [Saprospiraceae bacterium]